MTIHGRHQSMVPLTAGSPWESAQAALVLVHGRGGSAAGILTLAEAIPSHRLALVAPRAAGQSWYPESFLAPVEHNEPGRSAGLTVLDGLVRSLGEAGITSDRVVLAGFSQGACLTLEYAARHPRRFGAVVGLTGGLMGAPGSLSDYRGSLEGTPVFLGSGDPDPHVPWSRVEETAAVFESLQADVRKRRYPGRPHGVDPDELRQLSDLVESVLGRSRRE